MCWNDERAGTQRHGNTDRNTCEASDIESKRSEDEMTVCLQMDTEMKRSGIEVTDGKRSVDEMTV